MSETNEMIQTSQTEKISCQEVSSTSLQENDSWSWPDRLKRHKSPSRSVGFPEGNRKKDSMVNRRVMMTQMGAYGKRKKTQKYGVNPSGNTDPGQSQKRITPAPSPQKTASTPTKRAETASKREGIEQVTQAYPPGVELLRNRNVQNSYRCQTQDLELHLPREGKQGRSQYQHQKPLPKDREKRAWKGPKCPRNIWMRFTK